MNEMHRVGKVDQLNLNKENDDKEEVIKCKEENRKLTHVRK